MCGQRHVYGGDSRQDPARIRQPHRHGLGNAHGGCGLVRLRAALAAYRRHSTLPASRRSRYSWLSARFLLTCSICRALGHRLARASLIGTVEPVSATITSAVRRWARCFSAHPPYRLCHDHRDDVPHGVAGAAAKRRCCAAFSPIDVRVWSLAVDAQNAIN